MSDSTAIVEITSEVVSAYLAQNHVPPAEISGLIATVHAAFAGLGMPEAAAEPERPKPAVPVRKSVTHTHIFSLEDGKPYKALRRHLTQLGMTPAEYRAKWGLPSDYPMVAPAYSDVRSALAKSMGFGTVRRNL